MINKHDLIDGFVNKGYIKGESSNLYIYDNELWNYNTVIAIRLEDGNIIMNSCYYSKTTLKNQWVIRQCSKHQNLYEIGNLKVFNDIKISNSDRERYKHIEKHFKYLKTSTLKEDREIINRFLKGYKRGQNDRLKNINGELHNKYTNERIAYKDDEGYYIINSNYFNSHVLKYFKENENIIILSDEVFKKYENLDFLDRVKFRALLKSDL